MEYNTGRNHLIIPEYGRNIQKMIEYAITVENREERTKIAQTIVTVMGQLNPQLRDLTDFKHKLGDHLFIISDFKLDVDSPYPVPSQQTLKLKPERVPYPSQEFKFKHYGRNLELIIQEIIKLEDGPEKDFMIEKIANFMKMSYLNWNRDTVNDELIIEHLKVLSKGKLALHASARLSNTNDILAKNGKKPEERKSKNFRQRQDGRRRQKNK